MARTVLIVDDHPSFRATARMLLELSGYEVVGQAAGGHAGVAEAQRLNPDVVLLDINLPDIDGFEVIKHLAAKAVKSPVILISTRHASDYGALIATCGAHGFIPKDELSAEAIERVLAA